MTIDAFNKVFENKIIFDKKDLFKEAKIEAVSKEEPIENIDDSPLSSEELEDLVNLYNQDLKRKFTETEIKILQNTLQAQKQEADAILNDIKNTKNYLLNKINKLGDAKILDISKRSNLKTIAIEIFNEEKNEITHEDYFVLLELRKEIIKQQTELLLESSIKNV